ncbi:MAG: hypothetical protein EAY75_15060 [Bacteroidetes bacterium]|nr:MAG: hypothetical protein EAY75_15060 [Bacteroidota bacterium]
MNRPIYDVNWGRLHQLLMPTFMRNGHIGAMGAAMVEPVNALHNKFTEYRNFLRYWLAINGQVCFLQKMLNDRFDTALRRIYIADAVYYAPVYIFEDAENKALRLNLDGEGSAVFLYTNQETGQTPVDFTVYVPNGLAYNASEMVALLDAYKVAGKNYNITNY